MPNVSFTIAQRSYTLRCAAGQEAHLQATANALGERVDALASRTNSTDDRQLLVIIAIELLNTLQIAEANTPDAAELRLWARSMAERLDALSTSLDQLAEG
ncbi:MAG: cell division protein ZapA [Alphaproteobacteria bacterium]|jgi:cell division protein ZapA